MNHITVFGFLIAALAAAVFYVLIWQLLQQNGRMLLRLEALEKRMQEEAKSRA